MKDFEIDLPSEKNGIINVTDSSLYDYNFASYSLVPLQKAASNTIIESIREKLLSNSSSSSMVHKKLTEGDTEYVAEFSKEARQKIATGEWGIGVRKKTGELYAVVKDTLSGENREFVTLSKKKIEDLGVLPQLSSIQNQLAQVSEDIESLNRIIQRIEQGQYNDRFAGFFSARQLIIEALASTDEETRKTLLIEAIKVSNETIGKLMISIHNDALTLIDSKTKPKEAKRIDNLMQSSLGYLNSSVQLNLVSYTALGEQKSLFATLANYHSYIEQGLLKENKDGRSVAWLIDNGSSGNKGKVVELSKTVSRKVKNLIEVYENENKEEVDYEEQ